MHIIRIKDLQVLLQVSERQAKRYYSDIKNHFNIKVVLMHHFEQYFKIN